MNSMSRVWKAGAVCLLTLTSLAACVSAGYDGYGGVGYVGGVYEPGGYEYGGWGRGYRVAPRAAVYTEGEDGRLPRLRMEAAVAARTVAAAGRVSGRIASLHCCFYFRTVVTAGCPRVRLDPLSDPSSTFGPGRPRYLCFRVRRITVSDGAFFPINDGRTA